MLSENIEDLPILTFMRNSRLVVGAGGMGVTGFGDDELRHVLIQMADALATLHRHVASRICCSIPPSRIVTYCHVL